MCVFLWSCATAFDNPSSLISKLNIIQYAPTLLEKEEERREKSGFESCARESKTVPSKKAPRGVMTLDAYTNRPFPAAPKKPAYRVPCIAFIWSNFAPRAIGKLLRFASE